MKRQQRELPLLLIQPLSLPFLYVREQAKGGVNIRSEKADGVGRNKKLPPKRTQPNLGSATANALNHH